MPRKFRKLITFAQASQAGRELGSRSSDLIVKANAGYVLACWRWQEAT